MAGCGLRLKIEAGATWDRDKKHFLGKMPDEKYTGNTGICFIFKAGYGLGQVICGIESESQSLKIHETTTLLLPK